MIYKRIIIFKLINKNIIIIKIKKIYKFFRYI